MARRKIEVGKTKTFFKKGKGSVLTQNEGTKEMNPLLPFVISGGERTERYYFKHISNLTKYKFNIKPKYFGKESNFIIDFPKRIKEIFKGNPDAVIYCVFDYDTIHNDKTNRTKYESFKASIKKEFNSEQVTLCPSMPCIEYWFLLHFVNNKQLIDTCEDVDKILEPYMKSFFPDKKMDFQEILKNKDHLDNSEWVKQLCADGKLDKAIARAETNINQALADNDLDNQSFSYVYKLFKR